MKFNKEIKVGIVITLAIALFIFGFNFLKGKNIFSHQRKFYAIYNQIDGLVEANPVVINGYKIGQVKDITLHPDNSGRIVVMFVVNESTIQISKNSIAKVMSSDLLGSKAVQIVLATDKNYAQSGDTLKSAIEEDLKSAVDKRIAPLQKKAEDLISSIDSVMIVIQQVFNKDARDNLSQSFESIKNAIKTFEGTSLKLDDLMTTEKVKISSILSKIETLSSSLANNSDKLSNVIKNFSSISDSLAKANIKSTIDNANRALSNASQVLDKINKGEGSLGLLVNDKRLYNQLDSATVSLNELFIDMNENPKRYVHFSVFGKSGKASKKKKTAKK